MMIITGVGKSYIMGQAGAALLRSVNEEAFAIHAVELMHGCLGVVNETTTVIALSDSGETREVINAVSLCQKRDAFIIVVTSVEDSMLARYADQLHVYTQESGASVHKTIPSSSLHHQLDFFVELAARQANELSLEKLRDNHPGGTLYDESTY